MYTASTPRAIDVLLARYGESHRNPVNELIHIVCIPAIVFSLLGQFVGHHIEGKKPSFFDDLRFLLIGPLFVLSILYRRIRVAW